MIVITKANLKFLLAGRTLTITIRQPARQYRKERAYAVGINPRASICHAEVLHTEPAGTDNDGNPLITARIRRVHAEKPHLLAARSEYGYTTNPHQAMRDEPEAVTGPALENLAAANAAKRQHDHAEELKRQRGRSLGIRIKDAASRGEWDRVSALRRELDQLDENAA